MTILMRDVINALFPSGPPWRPEVEGDYDHLLDGIAENQCDGG